MLRKAKAIIYGIFLILLDYAAAETSETLKVQLKHGGTLIGRHLETSKGRHIRGFLGIPYAKPPIGDLRFQEPIPYPPWKGTKMATKEGSTCPQIDLMLGGILTGNENCLYLNVYTPPVEVIGNLSVMVYIHGGGFSSGSGSKDMYGPSYILEKDVILVAGNYRLGSLGFLSSETLDCPGNFGLKDQVEILKWVKEHISSFGGNPNSVTIFGESAGGASVGYHLQSPRSKGLFHKAIQQSGTIFNPWSYPYRSGEAANKTLTLASMLGCQDMENNWKNIINCLKKVNASEFVKNEQNFFEWLYFPCCPFKPVKEPKHESSFIEDLPRGSGLRSLDIPVLMGIVSDEGLLFNTLIISGESTLHSFKENAKSLLPIMLFYNHLDKDQQFKISEQIEKFYLKEGHNYSKSNHRNLTDIFSDGFFISGFDEFLEKRMSQESADTFVYIFDHRPPGSLTNLIGGGDEPLGVCHVDDLTMLFPLVDLLFPTGVYNAKDIKLREAMVEMWVNFADYGNPTPSGSDFKWEPTNKYPWNYARLGSQNLSDWYVLRNEEEYGVERIKFWKKLNGMINKNM